MRNLKKSLSFIILFLIFFSFTTCELLKKDGPCEDSILNPSIEVKISTKYYLYNNFNEKSDKRVIIVIQKVACGHDEPAPGASFEFTGFMNDDEYFKAGPVGYNLRNKNDRIEILYYYEIDDYFKLSSSIMLVPNDFSTSELTITQTDEIIE